MVSLLALFILIISFLGMLMIFLRKIPALDTLPPEIETSEGSLVFRVKNKILGIGFLKSFSAENFLHKILSKIRVLTLKTDNKTSDWLQKLREKNRRKKEMENDNYWKELKKTPYRRNDREDLPG